MTPSSLLRVYHSRDVAMKFQMTGERNLQNLLLSDQLFTGYQPPETNAALIFGTDFTAAAHILGSHLDGPGAQRPIYVKRRGGKGYAAIAGTTGELLRPAHLGNPVYYLPLGKDSLPLLRTMGYPMWQEMLLREISRELFHFDNHPRWSFELDGQDIYILVCLSLPQIDLALRKIRMAAGQKVRIVCLDWQEPLFRLLLEPYAKDRDIRLTRLPAAYMEELSGHIKRCWEGSYGATERTGS